MARRIRVGWANSFLITRVPLLRTTKHHALDLEAAGLLRGLNDGFAKATQRVEARSE